MERFWFDIDLDTIEKYEVWKPDSVKWAMTVDWAKTNDLIRQHSADFPANDVHLALESATTNSLLTSVDQGGLVSLYVEPIYATPDGIITGGHRITAIRAQGIRWALGQCGRDDLGTSVDESRVHRS